MYYHCILLGGNEILYYNFTEQYLSVIVRFVLFTGYYAVILHCIIIKSNGTHYLKINGTLILIGHTTWNQTSFSITYYWMVIDEDEIPFTKVVWMDVGIMGL